MGRAYAGILGLLAFGLAIARGVAAASGPEGTLLSASAALFVFATIGYVAGQIADYLCTDSVRTQFHAAMADWNAKQQEQAKTQPKTVT